MGGVVGVAALTGAALVACSPRFEGERPWKQHAKGGHAVDSKLTALTVADAGTGDGGLPPEAVALAAAEPAFKLAPLEKKKSDAYPCSDCHDADMETDPKPRTFDDDHADIVLNHGGGRFWCLECHDAEHRDMLVRIADVPVSFERADRVCAKCHFQQQRDFLHGAHGKRVGGWRGERVVWPCVRCHDPHAPAFAPRAPMAGPGLPGALGRARKRKP